MAESMQQISERVYPTIKDEFAPGILTTRERSVLEARQAGYTLAAISEHTTFTSLRVRQLLEKAREKGHTFPGRGTRHLD